MVLGLTRPLLYPPLPLATPHWTVTPTSLDLPPYHGCHPQPPQGRMTAVVKYILGLCGQISRLFFPFPASVARLTQPDTWDSPRPNSCGAFALSMHVQCGDWTKKLHSHHEKLHSRFTMVLCQSYGGCVASCLEGISGN